MKIKFIRFIDNVQLPQRAHYSDTGADIFMPEGGVLLPNESKVIPLGFGVEIPNGYTAKIQVRTSLAKNGLTIEGCAIDAGYNGEIHMIARNLGNTTIAWYKGDRLGYIEVYPIVYPEFIEDLKNSRNDGAFGSTGK